MNSVYHLLASSQHPLINYSHVTLQGLRTPHIPYVLSNDFSPPVIHQAKDLPETPHHPSELKAVASAQILLVPCGFSSYSLGYHYHSIFTRELPGSHRAAAQTAGKTSIFRAWKNPCYKNHFFPLGPVQRWGC